MFDDLHKNRIVDMVDKPANIYTQSYVYISTIVKSYII